MLFHHSDTNGEREPNSTEALKNGYVEILANRVTSLETKVKGLHSKMTSGNEIPFGLWVLAVCLKCGSVFQFDKTFRKGTWLEEDHFDCHKCGSVNEVIELISRQKMSAKTYAEIPEYEGEEIEA